MHQSMCFYFVIFLGYVLIYLLVGNQYFLDVTDYSHLLRLVREYFASKTYPATPMNAFLGPYIDLYSIISNEHILNFFSMLMLTLSWFLYEKIMISMIDNKRVIKVTLLLMAIHPIALSMGSRLMFESMNLFLLLFLAWSASNLLMRKDIWWFFSSVLAIYLFSYSHTGFSVIAMLSFALVLVYLIYVRAFIRKGLLISLLVLFSFWVSTKDPFCRHIYLHQLSKVGLYSISQSDEMSVFETAYRDDVYDILQFSKIYVSRASASRTLYWFKGTLLDRYYLTRQISLIVSYLWGPFYFELDRPIDFVPYLFSYMRILMMLYIYKNRRELFIQEEQMVFFIALYAAIVFIFSSATGNFGTAFRHNFLTDWILLLFTANVFDSRRIRRLRK